MTFEIESSQFIAKVNANSIVCQLEWVNPTYERYILGPILVNRHMSRVSKKKC